MRAFLTLSLIGYLVLCGWLVADSGLFTTCDLPNGCILLQQTPGAPETDSAASEPSESTATIEAAVPAGLHATGGTQQSLTLGSTIPEDRFKFRLDLNAKGAAIEKAISY